MTKQEGVAGSLRLNTKSTMVSSKEYNIPQVRLSYVSDCSVEHPKLISAIDVAKFIRSTYEDGEIEYRECFNVIYLNRANKILGFQTVSEGGTAGTIVDNKMIFTGALLANAHAIVLCHNHPSGTLRPSIQDDSITKSAVAAGQQLGIKVLDHVIVTNESFYSYNEEGKL